MERSLHVYLLRPYYKNFSKRLIKAPKLYFLDTGLAAYLTKWQTSETLAHSSVAVAFFETYVITEIMKSYLYRGLQPPLYYFRDKEGHEIDLLIEQNAKIYPLEIKLAASINSSHAANVEYIQKKMKNADRGWIICLTDKLIPYNRNIDIIPVGMIMGTSQNDVLEVAMRNSLSS